MVHQKCLRAAALVWASLAGAQQAAPEPASPWGGVRLSGLIDAYHSLNFNHPGSRANALRNFDVRSGQFSLNMARLSLARPAEPVGFQIDLGLGRAFEMMHAAEPAGSGLRYLPQAFVAFQPPRAGGLRCDFGKFYTAAGAEGVETHLNWNYSRSLLFAWAVPYYHFGLRATKPLGRNFSAGAQLVNGWNNVEDGNTGKTVGVNATITVGGVSWSQVFYAGPEKSAGSPGWRSLYDTTLLVGAGSRVQFYVNFDHGTDRGAGGGGWAGVAGAARLALTGRLALAPRLEWFDDRDGFATGTAQRLREVTLTGEWKLAETVVARLEFRRDSSNRPFFERGGMPGACRAQGTLLAGLVAYFNGEK